MKPRCNCRQWETPSGDGEFYPCPECEARAVGQEDERPGGSIDAQRLKPYIAAAQEQFLKDDFRVYPCHTNRASGVGHPCARFLTYSRTHWQQRLPPDPHLLAIFKLGWDLEEIVFKWLKERLKLNVIQPKDRDFSWAVHQLTGHMDCYLEEDGIWVPGEIKGISKGTWDTVTCWEDMKRSTRPWIAKWVGQLPIYLIMDEKPYGRFILFQKESGLLRDFPVVLDENLDLVEAILKRLEIVNRHVAAGTAPDRFYEPGPPSPICEGCDFGHICLPGSSYDEALKLMIEPTVESLLNERRELQERIKLVSADDARRLKVVNDQLKRFLEGKATPKLLIGEYVVTGKKAERAPKPYSFWDWDAKKLGDR